MAFEFDFLNYLQTLQNPVLTKIMYFFTLLGEGGAFFILMGVALFFFKKTRKCSIMILLSLLFGLIIGNGILKNVIQRIRPCDVNTAFSLIIKHPSDKYSFPSGHTLAAFEFAFSIFIFDKKWGIGAIVLASLVAFSRLYFYVHFPTDIIGGIVVAVITVYLACITLKAFSKTKIYKKYVE